MFSEVTVTIKGADRSQTSKFGVYEVFTMDPEDAILKTYINQAIEDFGEKPDDVIVKVKMQVE